MVRVPQELVLFKLLYKHLKSKDRCFVVKDSDSKEDRMVTIGLYSKGTDDQMYTSSSICKYRLLVNQILKNKNKVFIQYKEYKAKVCMTAKRKTTYCPVIWTHITLARCYVRKYK